MDDVPDVHWLVVLGEQLGDQLAAAGDADLLEDRLVVVAGAGHLTTLDQPEQVTRALVAWLQA